MFLPENNNSAARPCPMMRGRIAQAPISQPASPTFEKINEILADLVPSLISLAIARIAPAPTQIPSIAAITGCGQFLIALTKSPVIRVKANNSFMLILVSGPMISCTSPPEQKFPPAPVITTAFTSSM